MIVLPAGTSTARAMGNFEPPASAWRTTSDASALDMSANVAAIAAATRTLIGGRPNISDSFLGRTVKSAALAQCIDIGDDVVNGLRIRQSRGDGAHLSAIRIATIVPPQARLVVPQLSDEIPIRTLG